MNKLSVFVLLILLFAIAGCDSYGPEELDRLVKEDSNFKQMITARDQARSQMKAIKDDMLAKKKIMDAQVEKVHQDYDAYAKVQNLKIEKYQATIDANRNLLKREIDTGGAQLSAKETELEGYQKTLSDVKKVMRESKGIKISAQEKEKWEERVLLLSEKIRPLLDGIQELRLQTRLKKQKLTFLR